MSKKSEINNQRREEHYIPRVVVLLKLVRPLSLPLASGFASGFADQGERRKPKPFHVKTLLQ
jgi:hypothetical protein